MSRHWRSVVWAFAMAMAVPLVAEARESGPGSTARRTTQRPVNRSSRGAGAPSAKRLGTAGANATRKPNDAHGGEVWLRRLRCQRPGGDMHKHGRVPDGPARLSGLDSHGGVNALELDNGGFVTEVEVPSFGDDEATFSDSGSASDGSAGDSSN